MEYKVKIDAFEGPLDLLLHLIKESDINIIDINIEEITKQYLDYIHTMETLNLNIASEYLVMASSLIEMKSNLLLPKPRVMEEEEEIETKEDLIEKLLMYQQYKSVTKELQELELMRKELYAKEMSDLRIFEKEEQVIEEDVLDISVLMEAFQKFLQRKEEEKPLDTKITKKEYSVTDRSIEIKNIIKEKKKVIFEELFEIVTKEYIVVTFLAILNLSRRGEIDVQQENNFKQIYLTEKGSV